MTSIVELGGDVCDLSFRRWSAAASAAITRRRLVRYKLRLAFLRLLLGLGAAGLTLLGLRGEYACGIAFWLGICRHIVEWGLRLSILQSRADAEFAKAFQEFRARYGAIDAPGHREPDEPGDIESVDAVIRTYRIEDTGSTVVSPGSSTGDPPTSTDRRDAGCTLPLS